MALQFISGNSISDRTAVMYETICAQACRHPDKNYIFLVPEQATLQVQRELSAVHPDHVLGNIDVVSFGRLAHRLLNEQAGKQAVLLDDTGKSMILRRIADGMTDKMSVAHEIEYTIFIYLAAANGGTSANATRRSSS